MKSSSPRYRIEEISRLSETAQRALLALNNAHAQETSFLSWDAWRSLVERASYACCVDGDGALLFAFDQRADYENPNFDWFRVRFETFVYVDRIIVAGSHQGAGLGKMMYEALFEYARNGSYGRIVCEVNVDPPNPGSDAFHEKLGFMTVGSAVLEDRGKTVRYLTKDL